MEDKINDLIQEMIYYYQGDPKRVHHFLKVYAFSKSIAAGENINRSLQTVLETAAVLHDIGIKTSEEKYRSSSGYHQQIEGPPIARDMLLQNGFEEEITDRICFLIGHHHTYTNIDGLDYQILVEADFLVNIYEEELDFKEIEIIRKNIFKTKTGIKYLNQLYPNK